MKPKPTLSAVRTALDSHAEQTARVLAETLGLNIGSVRRALRQLRREQAALVAVHDARKGNYWIAAQFNLFDGGK